MERGNGKCGDRRVQKTRKALRLALLSLMTERGWDDTSVQDICDRADIGRSTFFYMHFQSKEQLLEAGLSDLSNALRRGVGEKSGQSSRTVLPFVRGLIEHVAEQRRLLRAMVGSRSGHVVRLRFREMVFQLVADDLARLIPAGWPREGAVYFFTGALLEMLTWVSEAKQVIDVDTAEQFFLRLSTPILSDLGGAAKSQKK